MSLQAKVGSFNTGTGAISSTVVVSGLGFQPKCIYFWYSGRTESVDTVGPQDCVVGGGAAISATERGCNAASSGDALASSNTARIKRNDGCIVSLNPSGVTTGRMDFVSMDADGFTLEVDEVFSNSMRVSFLALGGDSLTDQNISQFESAAAVGNVDYAVGFQPSAVIFGSVGIAGLATLGSTSEFRRSFGAATGSSEQGVASSSAEDGVATMNADHYAFSGECLVPHMAASGAPGARAEFVQFLGTGFRLNWLEINATLRAWFALSLEGLSAKVGNLLTETDTVTPIVVTGLGFRPAAVLFWSSMSPENVQDAQGNHALFTQGGASGPSEQISQAARSENGVADSNVATAIDFGNVYLNINPTSDSLDGAMALQSLDADGFTAIMTDADPSSRFVGWLALGPVIAFFVVVAVTGDGNVAAAATSQRFGSVTASAGGAVNAVTQKNGVVAASTSGDGALSSTAAHGGTQASSVSGDGAIDCTGSKQAYVVNSITADGVILVSGAKGALSEVVSVGGGGLAATGEEGAQTQAVVSGDGTVETAAFKAAFSEVTLSVDGVVQVLGFKDGQSIATVAGDGAVATVGSKQAFSEAVSIGGGGLEVEGEEGSQTQAQITGGGNVTATGTMQALVLVVVSGDGVVDTAGTKAAFGTVTISGDGLSVLSSFEAFERPVTMKFTFKRGTISFEFNAPGLL